MKRKLRGEQQHVVLVLYLVSHSLFCFKYKVDRRIRATRDSVSWELALVLLIKLWEAWNVSLGRTSADSAHSWLQWSYGGDAVAISCLWEGAVLSPEQACWEELSHGGVRGEPLPLCDGAWMWLRPAQIRGRISASDTGCIHLGFRGFLCFLNFQILSAEFQA